MTMNAKFQSWFSQGKAVEALCGLGDYFVPDVTYRKDHDFVLAVGELLEWARQDRLEDAARAFEVASTLFLEMGRFEQALRLLRCYFVLRKETQASLPLDETRLASSFCRAVRETAGQLSRDEGLRKLLLLVSQDFPSLKTAIGLEQHEMTKRE